MQGKLLINGDDFYCGSSSNSLKQLALKSDIPNVSSIPSGIITMWSGSSSNIPSGWLLCNGSNGTPDLRDRFIVGAGNSYGVGNTGGAASVTLSTEQMPSHSHVINVSTSSLRTYFKNYNGGELHPYISSQSTGSFGTTEGPLVLSTSTNKIYPASIVTTGTMSSSLGSSGGSQAHENRPSYYALCFIMKS